MLQFCSSGQVPAAVRLIQLWWRFELPLPLPPPSPPPFTPPPSPPSHIHQTRRSVAESTPPLPHPCCRASVSRPMGCRSLQLDHVHEEVLQPPSHHTLLPRASGLTAVLRFNVEEVKRRMHDVQLAENVRTSKVRWSPTDHTATTKTVEFDYSPSPLHLPRRTFKISGVFLRRKCNAVLHTPYHITSPSISRSCCRSHVRAQLLALAALFEQSSSKIAASPALPPNAVEVCVCVVCVVCIVPRIQFCFDRLQYLQLQHQ